MLKMKNLASKTPLKMLKTRNITLKMLKVITKNTFLGIYYVTKQPQISYLIQIKISSSPLITHKKNHTKKYL